MKIYFTAAITDASQEMLKRYHKIIEVMEQMGVQVLADYVRGHLAKELAAVDVESDEFVALSQQMAKSKMQADVVVCEVSMPSFRVGQEITYALTQGKPVIALYYQGSGKPKILRGIHTDRLFLCEYTEVELAKVIGDYIEYAKETADTRFNFFVSPKQQRYLGWVSAHRKQARAVFLRNLIEKQIESDEEYLEATTQEKQK